MTLYHIEYEDVCLHQTFICKAVGDSPDDVIHDIMKQVGAIKVIGVYYMSHVDRITASIRRRIIKTSLRGKTSP